MTVLIRGVCVSNEKNGKLSVKLSLFPLSCSTVYVLRYVKTSLKTNAQSNSRYVKTFLKTNAQFNNNVVQLRNITRRDGFCVSFVHVLLSFVHVLLTHKF